MSRAPAVPEVRSYLCYSLFGQELFDREGPPRICPLLLHDFDDVCDGFTGLERGKKGFMNGGVIHTFLQEFQTQSSERPWYTDQANRTCDFPASNQDKTPQSFLPVLKTSYFHLPRREDL